MQASVKTVKTTGSKMKITFDLTENGGTIYRTKEEWEENPHSAIGFSKTWKWGTYLERYSNEPDRFPCICFESGWRYCDNGPDEIITHFIYDFTIKEEDDWK